MSFDWSDYLTLATELVAQSHGSSIEEARYRAAISRAYYAAYCSARNQCLTEDPSRSFPRRTNAHCYVRNQFLHSSDRAHRLIGSYLDTLRKDRNRADYDDIVDGVSKLAQFDLNMAADILATLDGLKP